MLSAKFINFQKFNSESIASFGWAILSYTADKTLWTVLLKL